MSETRIPFVKMHGLGNDFVIVDARTHDYALDDAAIARIADRRIGVGCDQFITLKPAKNGAAAFMQINNADGGEVEACGNAMRAVARILLAETGESFVDIETVVGRLSAEGHSDGSVTVDMGEVRNQWENIPLAEARDTLDLELGVEGVPSGVAVNIGNPHLVLFVADAQTAEVETLGPGLERHKLFPERTNVEFVTVQDRTHLRMRVWERGVGVTRACGTGACASLVAAVRRDLAERKAWVELDGGHLEIEWRESDNHVLLTGPASRSFTGEIDPALLAG